MDEWIQLTSDRPQEWGGGVMDDHTLDAALVAPRHYDDTHTAYLTVKRPPKGKYRESWYRYDVEFDAQIVVRNKSKDPERDLARVLLSRGIKGVVTVFDAITGKPRTIVNIEKAAKLTVLETRRRGPRFIKWKRNPFACARIGAFQVGVGTC